MPAKLSLMVMTKNGSWRLERMIRSLSGKVDETVIGIDTASDDDTEERARRYTTKIFRIENSQGYIEPHIGTLFEKCTGDWILRLDDDEIMSFNFSLEAIPLNILSSVDLIGFPRAWIVQRDPPLYIGTGSLQGELVPQFRLMKRSASWRFISQIHTPGFEMKPAHVIPTAFIFHMNLLDQSLDVRRAKFDFYQSRRPATWNRTYLLDPKDLVASGVALRCSPEMCVPQALLRSCKLDFSERSL